MQHRNPSSHPARDRPTVGASADAPFDPALVVSARLRRLPSLAELPDEAIDDLARLGVLRDLAPGDLIASEGEENSGLHILLRGRVKMVRTTPTGRDVILTLFEAGDLFGASTVLGGGACHASLVAMEHGQSLSVARQRLFELFARAPERVEQLMPVLADQLVECKNCIVEMTGYRVEMRFAGLFVKLAEKVGVQESGEVLVPVPLTRRELSEMTATALETCIRTMSRWEKEGLVTGDEEGFRIHRPDELARLARGEIEE